MNCKPGDLAIGISATPDKLRNIGCVVRVLRPWPGFDSCWQVETLSWSSKRGVEVPPGSLRKAADRHMRPLRNTDGLDEILRLTGLPMSAAKQPETTT